MKRFSALVVCTLVTVGLAVPAAAGPRFGASEDQTKYADDGGAWLYGGMNALGMTENRMTVRWNPAQPTTIQDEGFLNRSVPVAAARGIRVIFQVYPKEAYAFSTDTDTRIALFASYLQTLVRTYPQVTDYIVGNEPNEAYFWQPQVGPSGEQLSGPAFERLLAVSYDALKAANPAITVIGAGPSGSGNDRTSTSPVRFIKALGDAYRASGRTVPIMDKLGFHVYPPTNTDPPTKHFDWPNAGATDLDRIKQAVWDAFNGTAQPTFAEGSGADGARPLTLMVDEFGWQVAVDPSLAGRYTGVENVPTVREADQAQFYGDLIRTLACDPAVSDLMVFHLIDEIDLNRFQSGLLRIDGSPRQSFDATGAAIASAGSCATPHLWTHTTEVIGASATFDERNLPARQAVFGLSATAREDTYGKAGVFRLPDSVAPASTAEIARSLSGVTPARRGLSRASLVLTGAKLVKAGYTPRFEFRGKLTRGYYVYAVRLTAAMNPARAQTIVSRVVQIGQPGARISR